MKKVSYVGVELTELHPEEPQEGDKSYRVIQYADPEGQYVCWEGYVARWEFEDVGGPEYGPKLSLDLGVWGQIGFGMGRQAVEELQEWND